MTKRIAGLVLSACLCLSLTTGCIGGMALSGRVQKFNLEVAEGKWVREAVFLALYFIPVYPFAGMADLLVVNSIEFHTGTNPVSGKPRVAQVGETRRIAAANGTVSVSTLREDGSIDLAITEPGGVTHFVNLGERGERVIARDIDGHEIASVARGADLERSARTPN
jgi:hypothetical protein